MPAVIFNPAKPPIKNRHTRLHSPHFLGGRFLFFLSQAHPLSRLSIVEAPGIFRQKKGKLNVEATTCHYVALTTSHAAPEKLILKNRT
jgi:hypothetical protein